MKPEWDYTTLASFCVKRPPYAAFAIDRMLRAAGLSPGMLVCDIGAGVAHLTIPLAEFGLDVVALEPNTAMRTYGQERMRSFPNVQWVNGCGESTGQPGLTFDLVTFGSSFNVVDRTKALKETARILKRHGWFACLWNHRDLDDPLQKAVEGVIHRSLPAYDYGVRRQDQSAVIQSSGLFRDVRLIEARVVHTIAIADWLDAWRSHATLRRQAGDRFEAILIEIERLLIETRKSSVGVPYTTRIWLAQKIA